MRRKTRWIAALGVAAIAFGLIAWYWSTNGVRHDEINAAVAARDFEKARELLNSTAAQNPDDARTQFLLARVERHLDNFRAARGHLRRARVLGYPSESIDREEILLFAQSGHLERAEPHLARLLDEAGAALPEVCEAFCRGYFRHLQFDSARQLLDRWQQSHPHDPQPHLLRAAMWGHLQQWDEAEQSSQAALQLDPQLTAARFGLASSLFRQSKYEQAAEQFQKCLHADADNHAALAGWADCLFNLGADQQSRKLFARVLDHDPHHFGAQLGMGRLALLGGRPQEALKWLEPTARQRPFDMAARYHLAMALKGAGRADDARQHFDYVATAQTQLDRYALLYDRVAEEPDNLAIRHELGVIVLNYFEPAKGLAWLQSVLRREPEHSATHRVLAAYFQQQGQTEQAAYHRQFAARD